MIENLTEEQEKKIDEYVNQAIKIVHSGSTDYNIEIITRLIDFMYEKNDIPIVICASIEDMYVAAEEYGYKKKKGETYDYLGLGYDLGWTYFYKFMEDIGVDFSDIPEWGIWKEIDKSGIYATLLFENVAFVCIRPSVIKTNKDGNLHCENGMAIQWVDGTGFYYLNGVDMDEKQVMTPSEKIEIKSVLEEKNVEVRRELIRKIGIERFILKAGAKVLDKKGDYELLSIKFSDGIPDARYLKMKNPSIGTWHVEGVEGICNTVQDALNWRAGNIKEKWSPVNLT